MPRPVIRRARRPTHAVASAALLLALPSGACSFAFVKGPPPGAKDDPAFICTEGRGWPTIDGVLAGLTLLTALGSAGRGDTGQAAGSLIAAGAFGASTYYGFKQTGRCREAVRERDDKFGTLYPMGALPPSPPPPGPAAPTGVAPPPVASPPAGGDDKAVALVIFEEARRKYDLAKYPEALDGFQRAYERHPDPVFLFNVAQCHFQMNQRAEALTFYRRYLTKLPQAPNRASVEKRIKELEKDNPPGK